MTPVTTPVISIPFSAMPTIATIITIAAIPMMGLIPVTASPISIAVWHRSHRSENCKVFSPKGCSSC